MGVRQPFVSRRPAFIRLQDSPNQSTKYDKLLLPRGYLLIIWFGRMDVFIQSFNLLRSFGIFFLFPCMLVCMPLPPTASGDHLQRRDSGGPLTIGLRVEPAVFSTSKESRRVKTVPLQDTPRKALCGHGLDGTTHLVNSHSRFLCAYFFWSRFRLSGQLLILWYLNNYAAERTVYDNKEYISVLTGSSFCAGFSFLKANLLPALFSGLRGGNPGATCGGMCANFSAALFVYSTHCF